VAGLALGAGLTPTPGGSARAVAAHMLDLSGAWPSYRFEIAASSGGRVRAWARGIVVSPGAVVWAGAENPGYPSFTFRAFFQPDAVYVETDGTWHRVPYAHPAAAELQDLQDPLRIWRRVVAAARRAWQPSAGRVAVAPAWGGLGDYLGVDLRQVKSGHVVFTLGARGALRSARADLRLNAPDPFTGSAGWTIVARFQPAAKVRPSLPSAARGAPMIR
jgi:hypothetical protein